MHSPVTVLNSVPSAHVCRNAFKESKHEKSEYNSFNSDSKENKYQIRDWISTAFVQTYNGLSLSIFLFIVFNIFYLHWLTLPSLVQTKYMLHWSGCSYTPIALLLQSKSCKYLDVWKLKSWWTLFCNGRLKQVLN